MEMCDTCGGSRLRTGRKYPNVEVEANEAGVKGSTMELRLLSEREGAASDAEQAVSVRG